MSSQKHITHEHNVYAISTKDSRKAAQCGKKKGKNQPKKQKKSKQKGGR